MAVKTLCEILLQLLPLTLANYHFIDLQKYWKTYTPVQLRLGVRPQRWIAILTGYFSAISDAPVELASSRQGSGYVIRTAKRKYV